MNDKTPEKEETTPEQFNFKAETQQLLNILIHSLYTEREIFVRELISNASDALTRVDFEILTNREVLDPDVELTIRISTDEENRVLTIEDTGIGMNADEMISNLGTIARSGAREFIAAASQSGSDISKLIGQFGVGFYSAFMAADSIEVVSRSYKKDAQAARWTSNGSDTYTIESAEKENRGTTVTIHLNEDSVEFAKPARLREIIKRHSDFIPFPIFLDSDEEQINRQTAIWRQSSREVKEQEYHDFYQQLTLDFEPPLMYTHMAVDAPVQMYAVLYVPSNPEKGIFAVRKENGLKLYARQVMIQEFNRDLLPEYFSFIDGVVDSEDLPLNVSRESVQASRVISQLRKLVTARVIEMLKDQSIQDQEKYIRFWESYGGFIKQGVAVEQDEPEKLYSLLRFNTTSNPESYSSLDEYIERMPVDQKDIYYIMGEDRQSVLYSPHLDQFKKQGVEVILMTDPVDAFMLMHLKEYEEHNLTNVATAALDLPESDSADDDEKESGEGEDINVLVERFKSVLGDQISDVRITKQLVDSPARLVDPEGTIDPEMQRVYRYLEKDFNTPKKVLELNPDHPLIEGLSSLPSDDARSDLVIEQIFEDALLIEGLHPDPASMIRRIQQIMQSALDQDQPAEN